MKQKLRLLSTLLLLAVVSAAWGEETGTITFGNNGTKINGTSVEGDDDLGNTWTITTEGTTSFTSSTNYYQVGSGSKPATSITFTTTLSEVVNITSMSAKFGGFSGTAGNVTLKVGETTVGTGSLNGTNDVVVSSTSTAEGTVLTVTVTGIAKGVKVYNVSYTYSTGEVPVDNRKETTITFPEATYEVTFGETFNAPTATVMAEGAAIEGAIVNYSSDNTSVATVNETTGAVELVAAGNAVITATYEGDETNYKGSEGSYTLTVKNAPVEGQLFYESFDKSDGTGGRDGEFSGSVGTSSLEGKTDETWATIGNNGASQCIKLGTSSAAGTVKTGSIALNGNGELTFEAAGWASGTNTVTVSVEGATISNSSFTLDNSNWKQYTVNLIDGNGEVYVTFKMKRGFLDEIKVKEKAADPNFVAAPTFSNEGGEVVYGTTVELSQADAASIIYTTDGTDPTLDPANGQTYSEPIAITDDMTIKAIAVSEAGYTSDVVSATFTVKRPDAPVFSPDGGVVESGAQVTITGNGTIYYTTDNSTPTVKNGTKYTAPITINEEVTIKAIVVDEHGFESRYATATFQLQGKLVNEDEEGNLHFDLTNNSWGFPTDYTTGTNQYTNSGYTLTLSAASSGYKFNDGNDSYVIIGKEGATLSLPAFSIDVEKIEFVGRTGASGKVTTNIFVGENAASEEATGSTGTSSFDIAADYQSTGNVYTLKVTSDHNFQITEIVVYKKLVTFDEKANNASDFAVVYDANVGENKNVKMLREFGSGYWNTLVVPFDLTRAQLEEAFGEGVQVAKYTDFDKPANIKFETVDGDVTRADLMIVKPAATVTNPIFKGVTLEEGKAYDNPSGWKNYSDTNFAINGRFTKQVLKDDDSGKVYFLNKQGLFTHPTSSGNVIRGFRWFIQLKTPDSSTGAKITLDVDGDVTSIDAIDNGQLATDAIYNLSGQRVNKAQKGIYIVNGKKVVVK